VLTQQTIPASRDASELPPMAADANIPFADHSATALPFAFGLRPAAATITAGALERLALDGVRLADVEYQPANAATAIIAGHPVIPVELNVTGITVTARPLRDRGSSWE
jgi:hypothetical protein